MGPARWRFFVSPRGSRGANAIRFYGEIIKSYCPWVWQNANRKKHCKQMQNNVLVSTACPCACAGY